MKKYILIAGVNGAGKSTLFRTLHYLREIPRVNTDEIVGEFGDWKEPKDMLKAGKIAIDKVKTYLNEGTTFNQETTLCGRSIMKNIKQAKKNGFYIEMHYVGVENVEIAKSRVKLRVEKGGHGINEADIDRRYVGTFDNLKLALNECDKIIFYDNSLKFNRFAVYKKGEGIEKFANVPEWFKKIEKDIER